MIAVAACAGCQCCSLTDHYGDLVDDVNEHTLCLDPLYHAELDLTRIGYSDWCRSKLNRLLCGRGCCRSCCHTYATTTGGDVWISETAVPMDASPVPAVAAPAPPPAAPAAELPLPPE